MSLTSDDGQLGGDRHLALAVACHALVGVFIPGGSERLDPQHGAGALVKLDGLDSRRITERKTETIGPSRGDRFATFSGVNHHLDGFTATREANGLILEGIPCGSLPPFHMARSHRSEGFRVLQEDTLGRQTSYRHKGLNAKSRRENANNRCAAE